MNCGSPINSNWPARPLLWLTVFVMAIMANGCNSKTEPPVVNQKNKNSGDAVGQIVTSEELILKLTEQISGLANSAKNLQLPDHQSKSLFAETIKINDWEQYLTARRD